jgi:hypothetical protein
MKNIGSSSTLYVCTYIGILKRVLKQSIENENCLILSQCTYAMKRCFLKIS